MRCGSALAILKDGSRTDVGGELPRPNWLPRLLREMVLRGFTNFRDASSLEELFGALQRFRILCLCDGVHMGRWLSNNLVERSLIEQNASLPANGIPAADHDHQHDYELKLFNGDVGSSLQMIG